MLYCSVAPRMFGLRRLCSALLLVAAAGSALAQDLSAEEILERIEESAEAIEDATFLVTGKLFDLDGTVYDLEIDVEVIPGQEVLRAYFLKPDALADNFVIIDGQDVYNYLFVTNQVMLLDINDPDALGGLLPATELDLEERAEQLEFGFELDVFLEGWTMTVEGYEERPEGNVYLLRFTNDDAGAEIGHVNAEVFDDSWHPHAFEFVLADGTVIAELFVEQFVRDPGLDPAELRYIPPDAEIIDER